MSSSNTNHHRDRQRRDEPSRGQSTDKRSESPADTDVPRQSTSRSAMDYTMNHGPAASTSINNPQGQSGQQDLGLQHSRLDKFVRVFTVRNGVVLQHYDPPPQAADIPSRLNTMVIDPQDQTLNVSIGRRWDVPIPDPEDPASFEQAMKDHLLAIDVAITPWSGRMMEEPFTPTDRELKRAHTAATEYHLLGFSEVNNGGNSPQLVVQMRAKISIELHLPLRQEGWYFVYLQYVRPFGAPNLALPSICGRFFIRVQAPSPGSGFTDSSPGLPIPGYQRLVLEHYATG